MKRIHMFIIFSGGQTGVDRAALDFAVENRIETGGWIPKNRLAEDGEIARKYKNLRETETENPTQRTKRNVKDSDATLILSRGKLKGGSLLTKRFAEKYKKPFLHVDFSAFLMAAAVDKTNYWLSQNDCKILNVAGPRASEDAEIYAKTKEFLEKLFSARRRL